VAALRVAASLPLAQVRTRGLPVTVRTVRGTRTVRIRVFRLTRRGGAGAAAVPGRAKARRTLVVTVHRRVSRAGTHRYRVRNRKVRRLQPGGYQVEVRAGQRRSRLGKARIRTFVVRR
jgi:hypothetical protein